MLKKIVFIIAQGHTGSTLLDCVLGTHPAIVSSGELCYLNWKIEATKIKKATVEDQDICTCLRSFSECIYWKEVATELDRTTGINILENPRNYDRAFFGLYSFKERDGHLISREQKAIQRKVTKLLIDGKGLKEVINVEPKIKRWVDHEYALYEAMCRSSEKQVIVDSSKMLTKALIFKRFHPDMVDLIFIRRGLHGLTSSIKKRRLKLGLAFLSVPYSIRSTFRYERVLRKIRASTIYAPDEVWYEDYVSRPNAFLFELCDRLGVDSGHLEQSDANFFIDPSRLHLVAGNPMRYKGRQKVSCDNRWKNHLNVLEKILVTTSIKMFGLNGN